MSEFRELCTARLHLRRPHDDDVGAITEACQDPDIQRFTDVPVPFARSDAIYFVNHLANVVQTHTWAIHTLDADELVGMIGLRTRDPGVASIGYWAGPSHRGQGYLFEAATRVVAHGLDGLGYDRICWAARIGNYRSARLAASVGFRYAGRGTETLHGATEQVQTAQIRQGDTRTPQCWPAEVIGR